MKKIYYILAFAMLAFTACQKQPVVDAPSLSKTATLTFTLAQADYQLLPSSDYPYNTFSFDNISDANTYVPVILNAKYPQVANSSTAEVTFALGAPTVAVADSVYKDLIYTVTGTDYNAVTGNNFGDFSAADVLNFLTYKYPTPVANQLAIITYVLYNGTDNTVTNSFLYLNGAWKLIYQVNPAQYTLVGEGKYDEFTSSDLSKLPGYFNYFLKNDITIADTVKANDVAYVSYNYYVSSTKTDYQKVMALTYDGSNWGVISTQATRAFVKNGSTWIADPTVYYTLNAADIKLISNSTFGTSSQRTDLGKYGDFSGWSVTDLQNALILVLTTDFPSPKINVNYKITYLNYTGGTDVPTIVTFQNNGTAWGVKN